MTIKYKFDVMARLKEAGYNPYRMRQEKIFSESTIQKFRTGEMVSTENIARLCELLKLQPGDIIEYTKPQEH